MIVHRGRLLINAPKIFKSKIKACPVYDRHYLAFKHQILVAINSESCQTLIPSFCSPPSASVLFYSNLSRPLQTPFSRTGCRFRSAALHRIRVGTCWFVPISYSWHQHSSTRLLWSTYATIKMTKWLLNHCWLVGEGMNCSNKIYTQGWFSLCIA